MRRILFFLCVLASQIADAQITPSTRLLLSEGVLRGSPRLLGIAGAYVGIAEGAEGITRNPAAVVNKDPMLQDRVNVDFAAAMHFLPPWSLKDQDWDNDGRPDQIASEPGVFEFLGTQVIYMAGSVQYKNVGVGLGFDIQNFAARSATGGFNLGLAHVFASVGVALFKDAVLVGVGAESTHALVAYLQDRALADSRAYNGWGIQFGGLWRPANENYRIGFAFRPQTVGRPNAERTDPIGGLTPFSQIVAPARISLGGSIALGSGGRRYNITGREGWVFLGVNEDGEEEYSTAMTRWLVSTQLDVFMPVSNATYVAAFLEQGAGAGAPLAGNQIAFEPRIALEKEVFRELLRIRGGTYLEPPLVASGFTRPHFTFGGELYLFRLGPQRIGFGLSFDMASQYQNLSVAIGAWR